MCVCIYHWPYYLQCGIYHLVYVCSSWKQALNWEVTTMKSLHLRMLQHMADFVHSQVLTGQSWRYLFCFSIFFFFFSSFFFLQLLFFKVIIMNLWEQFLIECFHLAEQSYRQRQLPELFRVSAWSKRAYQWFLLKVTWYVWIWGIWHYAIH